MKYFIFLFLILFNFRGEENNKSNCSNCILKNNIKDLEALISTLEKNCKQLREELLKIGKSIIEQKDNSDSLLKWIKITVDLAKTVISLNSPKAKHK